MIGYVKTKEIVIKYMAMAHLSHGRSLSLTITQLISHTISYGVVRVYQDAIAIEALEILEYFKGRLLLVTDQVKHHVVEGESPLAVATVFEVCFLDYVGKRMGGAVTLLNHRDADSELRAEGDG